jgi:RNA-binding protein YlmH
MYSKILNIKLQRYSEQLMTETQNGLRKGRSCTDPNFCLKLLIVKRREYNLRTHLFFFIDFENAFVIIHKHNLFDILKHRKIQGTLLKATVDM